MKTFHWAALGALIALSSFGQGASQTTQATQSLVKDTPWAISSSGANFNIWKKTSYETYPNGEQRSHVHTYVELASGLNYLNNGVWTPSAEVVEPYATGAIAQQGGYQVIFANNLNTAGAIDMRTPDGIRLRSNIIGLSYFDRSSGNSVLIAQIQDSTGQLISANQVLYPNAFSGVDASVRYTYRKSGLEQDVILNECPQSPSSYGLNPDTTELEAITAFIDSPNAVVSQADAGTTDLDPDENISWGGTSLGRGKAFDLSGEPNTLQSLRVAKQYVTVQGQTLLLEKVSFKDLQTQLESLPAQASNHGRLSTAVSKSLVIPKLPVARATMQPIKWAAASQPEKGFVLDYVTVGSTETNYIFQSDTTYLISGIIALWGTNTFEGGTVIKFATNGVLAIEPGPLSPGINWNAGLYRPVVFTSEDDNSVGESFGSGTPTGYYGSPMLSIASLSTQTPINGARFSYAQRAIGEGCSTFSIYNAQIVNCQDGIDVAGQSALLGNVLFADVRTNLMASPSTTISAQNTTFANASYLDSIGTNSILVLTNCIFVNVTNIGGSGTVNAGDNGFYNSPTVGSLCTSNSVYPFQQVGAGEFYLTNGCSFAGQGTTNIGSTALQEIRKRTTYPPMLYSNVTFVTNLSLTQQAVRDAGPNLDLGYHYDPLDYVFGGCTALSNVTFSTGTAVGWFELPYNGGAGYGLSLASNMVCHFNGSPTNPCIDVRYDVVQEGGDGLWTDHGWLGGIIGGSGYSIWTVPIVHAYFTHFASLAGDPSYMTSYDSGLGAQAMSCEFMGGSVGGNQLAMCITNCLFNRGVVWQDQGQATQIAFENCTFYGGFIQLVPNTYIPIDIENCSCDGTTNDCEGLATNSGSATYDYNARTDGANSFPIGGSHDLTVAGGFNWENGKLGMFYLPTNSPLVYAGGITAFQAALAHYTVTTNTAGGDDVPDGTNMVSIGYHYVATDANGNPLGSGFNGIPGYVEDADPVLAILVQPVSQTVFQGYAATFSVTAEGVPPLNYQWYSNSVVMVGATNSSLTLNNVQTNETGTYFVIITNTYGSVTSSIANLNVSSQIIFSDFCEVTNALQINGDACITNTSDGCVLELTPSAPDQAGTAFLKEPVSLASNASFSTFFSFRLSKDGGADDPGEDQIPGADGITFILQTITNNIGGLGDDIGYGGITNSVAVEFDTYYNAGVDPILSGGNGDGNHVGVDTNGSMVSVVTAHVADAMNNGNIWYAWIDYNGTTGDLELRLSETNSRPLMPTLTNVINMVSYLGTNVAYIGFGSGTGGSWNQQDVLSWQVNPIYQPIGTNNVSVAITSPLNQTFIARTNIIISAIATSSIPTDTISNVWFYSGTNGAGTNVIGVVLTPTNGYYEANWIPPFGGTYVLTAEAIDSQGSNYFSAPVTNFVRSLPSVTMISPTNSAIFSASPTNLLIEVNAVADPSTSITNVVFYQGTNVIGSTNSGTPYTIAWSGVTNGIYVLHARATDGNGASGISSNITITVEPANQPPSVALGTNEVIYLSTNAIPLTAYVSDDGLPVDSTVSVLWTNLGGGTNVTFLNSSLPLTSAFFWATGTYILQLSASDTQYITRSNITFTVYPANQAPMVFAGASQTIVLPAAAGTNPLPILSLPDILDQSEGFYATAGLDYFVPSNCVIVTVEPPTSYGLELVSSNGAIPFSTISNLQGEAYITTARSTLGGFNIGDMFFGNGSGGTNGAGGIIMRMSKDGTTYGTNVWPDADGYMQSNAWVVLTLTNQYGSPVYQGQLRGGLWVDRTGVWGGDLIVSTQVGSIWRVNSSGKATLITQLTGGDSYEGITTIPNDPTKYGPWAGRIIVGGDSPDLPLFAIDTNGVVVPYSLGTGGEDIRVIPQSENLYTLDGPGGGDLELCVAPASEFNGMVGDILVADEGSDPSGGYLYRVRWDGTNFNVCPITVDKRQWEGINFVPDNLSNAISPVVHLAGSVTDDGEILPSPSNAWTVASGPGPVTFSDPSQTNSTAEFSVPGDYVLTLSAFDGQYTSSSNVTIHVLQNQPPVVNAGTNQVVTGSDSTILQGTASDDGLPYGVTNVVWSLIGGPADGFLGFSSSNILNPTVSFNTNNFPGTYVFLLTVDDGQATNWSEVAVTVESPSLVLTPTYGSATLTNTSYTVTARLMDESNHPMVGTVTFNVTLGPDEGTNWVTTTDTNGYAVFVYTNLSAVAGRDVIQASSSSPDYDISSQPVTKDWAAAINCGDSIAGAQIGAGGSHSIEYTNFQADYYVFDAVAGDTVELTLNQYVGPIVAYVRDPSGNLVAASAGSFTHTESDNPFVSDNLSFTPLSSGDYVLELFGPQTLSKYDLYFNCASETNNPDMEIFYNGTNVPSGGTVLFPPTAQGVVTNITLDITNAGNAPFEIVGIGTNGDFILTNNVFGSPITLAGGESTNFGIIFNATSNGVSYGALVLATNTLGSNYFVNFAASTYPTSAIPLVQIVSPTNGSTYMAFSASAGLIPFIANVTPGSAAIRTSLGSVALEQLMTNGPDFGIPYNLTLDTDNLTYTNEYSFGPQDYSFVVAATDANGQTGLSSPVLVHLVRYNSPSVFEAPQINVLCNGTNVVCGSSIFFPPTVPGVATNITLMITNQGNYPLGIFNVSTNSEFPLANPLEGTVLLPGTATNVGVVFEASAQGESVGDLFFNNNASPSGVYSVSFVGDAYLPGTGPAPTNNQPPVANDDEFYVQANSVNDILFPLANDYDTNGYPLTIVSTAPPSGGTVAIVDNGKALSYSPPVGIRSETINGVIEPADGFRYYITNGHGGSASAVISIVVDATDKPQVSLMAGSSSTTAGTLDPITATVNPYINVVKVDFYLGTDLIGEVTNGVSGSYVLDWIASLDDNSDGMITASATDKYGQVGAGGPIQVNVTPPSGGGQIVAGLDYLTDSSGATLPLSSTNLVTIRDGMFNLYGQAFHSLGSNVTWQLGIYTIDGTLVRDLTPASTGTVGSSTATNLLESCDLSTLMNGVYDLQLTVNGGYLTGNASVEFRLESNLKIGQFSFSQQDLIIPVNGIPLTVTRTYNSINPSKGDFGYGWTYALSDMNASLDETRETVTDIDGDPFSQRSGGSWDVTLTLPNGQTTTFSFYLSGPDSYGTYEAMWQPAPGVTATLAAQGDNRLETLIGSFEGDADLFYWDASPGTPMNQFDFPGFVLTTRDGTQYTLTRQDLGEHFMDNGGEGYYVQAYGDLSLSQITERNGDTIAINPSSVIYTATNGATRQVVFQRNDDNLITSISDPDGLDASNNPSGPPAVQYEYDANDNLVSVLNLVDRSGAGTYVTNSFSYTNVNFPHYITGIYNANGTQVAKNFYDDSGKLVAVQDANGNLTQFINNPTNNMEVIIDRLGYTNTYVYDQRGNVIAQTNQLGQVTTMAYDVNNNKTNEVMFLNGQPYATNSYLFDTNLNLVLVSTDPLGHTNAFGYDAYGNLTNSTDADGNSTANLYDGSGNLIQTTDALGHNLYSFYSGDQLLGSEDAVGTVTTNYYDPATGYLLGTAELDVSGVIMSSNSYSYDDNGNRLTSTVWRQANGVWTAATTTNVYDAMNRVVQTIDPDGGTNTVVYNATGQQAATIDVLGRTNSYIYDAEGRLIQTIYADSTTEESMYDANGNRVESIDQAGRITTYVYDPLNRLVETIYPDNTTNATVYDGVGRVAQTVDGRGIVTAFAYDAAGRRLAVTNAFGTSTAMINLYSYDANGNEVTFTDGLAHTTTNVFDELNRQVQVFYPDGTHSSTGYDAAGRRVAETNQDGIFTLYGYDGAGRLTLVTNALNKVTQYHYDEAGNEVAQIDALNRTNTYTYDGLGRRLTHTRPDNQTESFEYDLAGNMTDETHFYSDYVYNQYDCLNRLTNRVTTGGDLQLIYTATGQRQTMVDDYETTMYSYDSRDQLVMKSVNWNDPAMSAALSYGYDADGNVTNMSSSTANGVAVAYGYDALNRLTNVLSHGQVAASYEYDSAGNLRSMGYGNGVTNLYQYDSLNRLTNLLWKAGGTALGSFGYQLKAGGTRTNLSETVNGTSRSYAWSYDALYRMTNETITGLGSVSYSYDAVGNRTNRVSSLSALPSDNYYSYDTNDELSADGNTVAYGNFEYDADGNTTTKPGSGSSTSYSYDGLDRLISVRGSTNAIYDGDGNRIGKYFNSPSYGDVTTYYLVDDRNPGGSPEVVEEYQVATNLSGAPLALSRVYNYGLSLISEQQFNTNTLLPGTLSYYGYDGHGNVRFLMNTNGGITDTYVYDAYGSVLDSTGATPNNYLYCGQQYDPDFGLYYNRARYLSTDYGRFWTSDTYEGNNKDPLSLHKYLYAEDDPVNAIDPSGHDDLVEALATTYIQSSLASMAMSVVSPALNYAGQVLIPNQIFEAIENMQLPDCEMFGVSFGASVGRGGGVISGSVSPEFLMSLHNFNCAAFVTPGVSLSTGKSGADADITGYAGFAWNLDSSQDYADGIDVSVSVTGKAIPQKALTALANIVTASASKTANAPSVIAGKFGLDSANLAKINLAGANLNINNINNWNLTVSWSPSGNDFEVTIGRSILGSGADRGVGGGFLLGVSQSYQILPFDHNVIFK